MKNSPLLNHNLNLTLNPFIPSTRDKGIKIKSKITIKRGREASGHPGFERASQNFD